MLTMRAVMPCRRFCARATMADMGPRRKSDHNLDAKINRRAVDESNTARSQHAQGAAHALSLAMLKVGSVVKADYLAQRREAAAPGWWVMNALFRLYCWLPGRCWQRVPDTKAAWHACAFPRVWRTFS